MSVVDAAAIHSDRHRFVHGPAQPEEPPAVSPTEVVISSSSVAQIVALSSAVVVSSEAQIPKVSPFSHVYNTNGRSSEAKVISPPFGAGIGSTLLRHREQSLVSVTVLSNPRSPTQLLHSLPELSDSPVVVHIALPDADQDLSNLLLRSSVPLLIFSRTPDDAYRNALLLSKLSRVEKNAAIHIFYDKEAKISGLTDDEARSFLWSDTTKVNGTNGIDAKSHSASHLYALYQSVTSSASPENLATRGNPATLHSSTLGSSNSVGSLLSLLPTRAISERYPLQLLQPDLLSTLRPSQLFGKTDPATALALWPSLAPEAPLVLIPNGYRTQRPLARRVPLRAPPIPAPSRIPPGHV